jgi:hypothetical protein
MWHVVCHCCLGNAPDRHAGQHPFVLRLRKEQPSQRSAVECTAPVASLQAGTISEPEGGVLGRLVLPAADRAEPEPGMLMMKWQTPIWRGNLAAAAGGDAVIQTINSRVRCDIPCFRVLAAAPLKQLARNCGGVLCGRISAPAVSTSAVLGSAFF